MRTRKWAACGAVLAGFLALVAPPSGADVASDRAAAILVFPRVATRTFAFAGMDPNSGDDVTIDTVIQISNTSAQPVQLKCFYVDASSHCSISGDVCEPDDAQPCGDPRETCDPGWAETDFHVFLTPHQPLAWSALSGLAAADLPLNGTTGRGIGGASNAGTGVPPVAAGRRSFDPDPTSTLLRPPTWFNGELKCIVVDDQGRGAARNVVTGQATIVTVLSLVSRDLGLDAFQFPNLEQYSAIGIQATGGDANGDNVLELGGGGTEYNGCPNVLIFDHFFDGASNTLIRIPMPFSSELTLVPCNENFRTQAPERVSVQYLVYNEFEQRFSASRPLTCYFHSAISTIDTRDPTRSIFSAFVAGTLTGQTRIRGVETGLLGVMQEADFSFTIGATRPREIILPAASAAVNAHMQGVRGTADQIVLP